jgi:hypothetical protein
MIIRLPLKPFIAKFVTRQFGPQLKVTDHNYFSMLVTAMLRKFEKGNPVIQRPNSKIIDGVNFVGYDIFIGDGVFNKRGAFISAEDILKLNESMDNMICRTMYDWIYSPVATHKEVDYNIKAFRDMYDITEDELPFDNVKRWFYRERQRMEKRKNQVLENKDQIVIDFKYDPVNDVAANQWRLAI